MLPGSSPGGFGAGSSSQSMFGGAPAPSMIGNNQPFQGGQQTSSSFNVQSPFGGQGTRALFGASTPASGASSGALFSSPQFGGASPIPAGSVSFGQSSGGGLNFTSSRNFGAVGGEAGFGGIQSGSPLQGFGGQPTLSSFGASPTPASSGGGLFGTSSSQPTSIFGAQSPVGFSAIQASASASPPAQGFFGNSTAGSGPTIFGGGSGVLGGTLAEPGNSTSGTGLQFGGSSSLIPTSFGAPAPNASTGQASLSMPPSGLVGLFSGSAGAFGSSSQSSILEQPSSASLPFGAPSITFSGATGGTASTAAPLMFGMASSATNGGGTVPGPISFGMSTIPAANPLPEVSQPVKRPLDGSQGLGWGSQSNLGSQTLTTAPMASSAPAPVLNSGFAWGQSSTGAAQSAAPLFGAPSLPASSGTMLFNSSPAAPSTALALSSGQESSAPALMFGSSASAPSSTAQQFGGLATSSAPVNFAAPSGPASSSATSLFGVPAPGQSSTPTMFGTSAPATSAATTMFGAVSSAPSAGPGLFGQPESTAASGASGSVGATAAFSGVSGLFGTSSVNAASSGPSVSGAPSSAPLNFGSAAGGSPLFGASSGAAGMSAASGASAPQMSVGFGATPSAAVGAASSTVQAVAATTSNVATGILGTNVPSDISGRSLGDIKKRWIREAKDAHCTFKSLAGNVSTWDNQVLKNTATLDGLAEEYKEMDTEQQALIGQLEAMQTHHTEIHQVLNRLDSEVDSLLTQRNPLDYESEVREDLYARAIHVAADLITVDKQLRDIMEKKCLGIHREAEVATQENPVQASVAVVNNQLLGLMHMDEQANLLQNILEGIRLRGIGR